jgi:hypothetical protein
MKRTDSGDQNKEKKTRECGFINIVDPKAKLDINQYVKPPSDATNYIFWYSKTNPVEWGLTIKSIPNKGEKEGFPSQHTWKITWFCDDNKLSVANHCKSLAEDIVGDEYAAMLAIYNSYRKK